MFGNYVSELSSSSRLSCNSVICTPIIPCWIWNCRYTITQHKTYWISMQSVVTFICLLQVGAISVCNIHMTLLVNQNFNIHWVVGS